MLKSIFTGLRGLFQKPVVERELTDEVEHYMDMSERQHVRAGMAPEAARRAARLEMGGVESVKEDVRSAGWEASVETLVRDTRYAARRLARSPGFTTVAVLSLALGIGANSAIFSLVNATLIRHLPVRAPEQLMIVTTGSSSGVFSYPDYAELRDANRVFDGMIAWGGIGASLSNDESVELVSGAIVTGNFFPTLGVTAQRGRTLNEADDRVPGAHPVAVISHGLWQRRFGARNDIVGLPISLNGQPFTIVGVAPKGFNGAQLGSVRDLYVPMMMQAVMRPPRGGYSGEMNPDLLNKRTNRWLYSVGRLKPGISKTQAQRSLVNSLAQINTDTPEPTRNNAVSLSAVNDGPPGQRTRIVSVAKLLMAVVGVVLLIACANVANLLLARSSARRKEIAVRLSIGASRGRLVRQMLTESVLLAGTGGVAGLALAWAAIRALRATPPPPGALPITIDFALDWRVVLFTLGLSLLTGIVFGLAPALRASRPDLVPALKDDGQAPNDRLRKLSPRNALVVSQVALSLVLLISAGLFLRSLGQAQRIDPGIDIDRVVTAPLSINLLRYTTAQGRQFYGDVIDRVERIPGVESVALARWIALTGGTSVRSLLIEGREGPKDALRNEGGGMQQDDNTVMSNTVSLRYFETMGIALRGGRLFSTGDDDKHPPVAVVSEAFVKKHLAGAKPLGARFSTNGAEGPWVEIIGVVEDTKYVTVDETPQPITYISLLQNHETGMVLHVRTSGDPLAVVPAIRAEVHALEKSLPITGVQSMRALLDLSLYGARAGARMLIGFGALALLLATVGLYGVMSYSVSRRTRELGLRMALGAKSSDLLRQVMGEGALLVLLGVAVGLTAAMFLTGFLTKFLYGVSATDPRTFLSIPVILLVVSLVACLVPAWRATRVDPLTALRSE